MVTPHVDGAGDGDEEEEDSGVVKTIFNTITANTITANTTTAHESRQSTKRLLKG
jgi:hypothetical protein